MKYVEYIDEILARGVSITKNEAIIEVCPPMDRNARAIDVRPLSITCDDYRHNGAEIAAITWAIDCGPWKHSWHHEVKPENYVAFLDIIQRKVIEKADEMVKLNAVVTFLHNEIAINPVEQATAKKNDEYDTEVF